MAINLNLSVRLLTAAALCAAALLVLTIPSKACDAQPAVPSVKVSVVAILASEKSTTVDPRLESVASEIRKVHPHLTGFRFAKMTCKPIAVKGTETFELAAGQTADVTVLKEPDKDNWVQLKVSPPTLGEITYTTTCGKFFPIVTQQQTRANEWLIIAVRVQPCEGKK